MTTFELVEHVVALYRAQEWCGSWGNMETMATRLQFEVTIEIAASPKRVWEVMRDVERWSEWTPSVTGIRLDQEPLKVGSRMRIQQPKLAPTNWVVTELEDGVGFTSRTSSPLVDVTARHRIEARGAGARVHLSVEFTGLLAPLVARLTRELNQRYLSLEAEGLKKRSERSAAPANTSSAPPIPTPDAVAANGIQHIAGYVDRMLASDKPAAVLMISSLDGVSSFTLMSATGKVWANLIANWDAGSSAETAARAFFASRNVAIEAQEKNGQRILGFAMDGTPRLVTEMASAIVVEIYGLPSDAGLKFRFDEWSP